MDKPITKKEYVEIVDFLEKHERYLDSEILNVVKYLTDDIIELGYNIAYNTQKIGITNIKELYSSCFPKIFGKKINSDSTSYHIEKADFAYSYMWMSMLHILVFQLS